MKNISVLVRRLPEAEDLPLPQYMTAGAAGMDLRAAVREDITLSPGEYRPIPTGLCVALPEGFEAQIRPRSGLALKHGITLLNTPGTIDADYRGEIQILMINFGKEPFTVRRGDRIAQMVIGRVFQGAITLVDTLDQTTRNEGGFGHTGI
ncbi:MAG: dUTP diphosphatase [Bacillota bacterium]